MKVCKFERLSIVSYANAFFGAFFGFWCKSLLDPIATTTTSDWTPVALITISVLLAVSLHIAGLWKSRDISFNSPVGLALKDFKLNWSSLIVFSVAMGIVGYTYQFLSFPAVFGGILYAWWVVSAFVALVLTKPDEGN
jgi:hypothetical protein